MQLGVPYESIKLTSVWAVEAHGVTAAPAGVAEVTDAPSSQPVTAPGVTTTSSSSPSSYLPTTPNPTKAPAVDPTTNFPTKAPNPVPIPFLSPALSPSLPTTPNPTRAPLTLLKKTSVPLSKAVSFEQPLFVMNPSVSNAPSVVPSVSQKPSLSQLPTEVPTQDADSSPRTL
jgi:hypothetical protein